MAELDGIWWTATGDGPAIVVPRLNIDWNTVDLSALTDRFRVVTVAPRGFGPSSRPGRYDMDGFVGDVERVVDHVGIDSYATFGYSMNGVMAARLALNSLRVTAVACGGFPLTADLSGMGERARARNDDARRDPDAWADVLATYDPIAAVVFWDEVASLPLAALADLGRPLHAWWGADDTLVASLLSPAEFRRDLDARQIPYAVVPGLDHDAMLRRLDLVLPSIADWFAASSLS
ncbi:alpha/beta fold hydrolase [Aeromicrobium sp. 636]|uniref:Alpha/beta fold hydrolase n=1 Tax=Aeromicrobium senzhongii TaxID=2663859 RepID=A0A8I0ETT2_9ACTN|nr:alpha/beta hydrolase [Aeromicrobium sp. 636]MBC9225252.1 alpha/beta fold hydrolase [Aeromicrobium senzhongii]MCQ3997362.1 alpha/beta fold hydrolase [Aeromicrobium sp. 636]